MLKILHIIPSLRKGGAERLVLNICNELQKREDIQVKLVVLHPENEYEFLSNNIDIELCNSTVMPSISGRHKVNITDFLKIVNDYEPHIIHSHLFEAEMVSRWEILSDIKYFTHCHDNMVQFRGFDIKTMLKKRLLSNYYEKNLIIEKYTLCNNKFIVISKNTEVYFKENLPKNLKKKVVLLNNAIDFNHFVKKEERIQLQVKKIVNLVTIGGLTKLKNQIFLLDVMKELNKRGVGKYRLTIIGDGLMRTAIENKISKNQLRDAVRLVGLTDKVEDFLKKSDLYVYACVKEGFGLTIIEAMASGLPVVCLDGGGNRDIIEEGKNGFMIQEQNAEKFADKIIQLTESQELYQSMSSYAREYAKKYDIKEYVGKLIELYTG